MAYENSGTLTTVTRQSDGEATELSVNADLPANTSIDVTVHQDESGGQTSDSSEVVALSDGNNSYPLNNFSYAEGGTYWLFFDVSTSDTDNTPTVFEASVQTTDAINEELVFVSTSTDDIIANETTSAAESSDVIATTEPFGDAEFALVTASSFTTVAASSFTINEEAIVNEMTDVVPITKTVIEETDVAVASEDAIREHAIGSTLQSMETTIAIESTFTEGSLETIEAFLVPLHRIGLFANENSKILNT